MSRSMTFIVDEISDIDLVVCRRGSNGEMNKTFIYNQFYIMSSFFTLLVLGRTDGMGLKL